MIVSDDTTSRSNSHSDDDVRAEAAAHSLLRMVGEHPGTVGRLRAARIVGGFAVPGMGPDRPDLGGYNLQLSWPLREVVALVDALLQGGLLVQTPGPRPVLVLTRSGFRALEALDRGSGG